MYKEKAGTDPLISTRPDCSGLSLDQTGTLFSINIFAKVFLFINV